ncbi:MAG: hypothetical protein IID61_06345 [SAR324 cluster bacterium]|nr:hypothetical protein [SAR324 cluster bacterium]
MAGNFSKGLNSDFVSALNDEYKAGGWWKSLITDPELFVGIRNNYLNIYYCGNSLIKLENKNGALIGNTHYKYAIDPNLNEYIESKNGAFTLTPKTLKSIFIQNRENVNALKSASRMYSGVEKSGI